MSSDASVAEARIQRLPAPVRAAVRMYFRVNTALHKLRYRGLSVEAPVYIQGRLRIHQGTRVRIGRGTRVKRGVLINGGGSVAVGRDCLLNGCWIGARDAVTVGDRSLLSDCDVTDSDFHNLDPVRRHDPPDARATRAVTIGSNTWIGAKALVLKGSTVGENSVVGAAAVVRGEVPADVVVVGNPAEVVKKFERPRD